MTGRALCLCAAQHGALHTAMCFKHAHIQPNTVYVVHTKPTPSTILGTRTGAAALATRQCSTAASTALRRRLQKCADSTGCTHASRNCDRTIFFPTWALTGILLGGHMAQLYTDPQSRGPHPGYKNRLATRKHTGHCIPNAVHQTCVVECPHIALLRVMLRPGTVEVHGIQAR